MPNIMSLSVNQPPYLIQVWYSDGGHAEVTQVEAQANIDAHPNQTNAQIEAWAITQMQARWVGRLDQILVHLIARSPVQVQVLVATAGVVVPSNWWVG